MANGFTPTGVQTCQWRKRIDPKWIPVLGLIIAVLIYSVICLNIHGCMNSILHHVDSLSEMRYTWDKFTCGNCNNFTYGYLIKNQNSCGTGKVDVLFLVLSGHGYQPERDGVRQTWASFTKYGDKQIRTVFVLGRGATAENTALRSESRRHGDIIQGDFPDTYRTLTEKVMFGLMWVRDYCPNALYVVKTDDDMFHVPWRYVDHLEHVTADPYIAGRCVTAMPFRDPSLAKYVSRSVYPHLYTPYFCLGGAYILSQTAVRGVVSRATDVPYDPMEDHFVAGVCRLMADIPHKQVPGFLIQKVTPCFVAKQTFNLHKATPKLMHEMWDIVYGDYGDKPCEDVYRNTHAHDTLTIVVFVFFLLAWLKFIIGVLGV